MTTKGKGITLRRIYPYNHPDMPYRRKEFEDSMFSVVNRYEGIQCKELSEENKRLARHLVNTGKLSANEPGYAYYSDRFTLQDIGPREEHTCADCEGVFPGVKPSKKPKKTKPNKTDPPTVGMKVRVNSNVTGPYSYYKGSKGVVKKLGYGWLFLVWFEQYQKHRYFSAKELDIIS